jgi:hypothetical protein
MHKGYKMKNGKQNHERKKRIIKEKKRIAKEKKNPVHTKGIQ